MPGSCHIICVLITKSLLNWHKNNKVIAYKRMKPIEQTNRSTTDCKFPSDYLKNFDDLQAAFLSRCECITSIKPCNMQRLGI